MRKIVLLVFCLMVGIAQAQIQNAKTVEVKINGNCGMCKKTIEAAANKDDVASLDWNKQTKIATLTYDEQKTSPEEVLQNVANAGYDNEMFKADDQAYNGLNTCCQYTRSESKKQCSAKKSCSKKAEGKKSCSKKSDKDCSKKKSCSADKNKTKKSCSKTEEKKSCCKKSGKSCSEKK